MADVKGGYARPTKTTRISSSWQGHRNRRPASTEPGTDYAAAYGETVVAAEDGVIADVKTTSTRATGRYVTIDLDDGMRVRYLHLSKVLVKKGQRVKRGQAVAKSGASGFGRNWGYGAHVHVTLWARQAYSFGSSATLDFEKYVGPDNDGHHESQHVRNQQTWLNRARGEKLVVDGIRGGKTKAAYKRYQRYLKKNYGYTGAIDGIWGRGTQAAHQRYYDAYNAPKPKGRPIVRRGSRGQDVRDLQARLNRDYSLYSKLTVDGIFGAGTEKVVREFQRRAGLKVDGIVGSQTWAKLGL